MKFIATIGKSSLLLLFVSALAWIVWFPAAGELDMSSDVTVSEHRVGSHRIRLEMRRLKLGDNGDVEIRVLNAGVLVSTLSSQFNYDTLQRRHPMETRWAWRDGDLWPDLVLELSSRTCWIGSRDGKVHD